MSASFATEMESDEDGLPRLQTEWQGAPLRAIPVAGGWRMS
jgi:hypothetical protein